MTERFEENSRRTQRVIDVQAILAHLNRNDDDYTPFQTVIEDTQEGFDMNGDFHVERNDG